MAERLYYCAICQVKLSGPAPAQQHYESSKHKKKEEIASVANILSAPGSKRYCRVCNIACDTEAMLKIHEQSERHQQMTRKVDNLIPDVVPVSHGLDSLYLGEKRGSDKGAAITQSSAPVLGFADTSLPASEKYYEMFGYDKGKCYVCQIELTSRKHAEQHLSGQKHQKAVLVAQAQKQFFGATRLPLQEHPPSSLCSYSSSSSYRPLNSSHFTGDQSIGHPSFPQSLNSMPSICLIEDSVPESSMSSQNPAFPSSFERKEETKSMLIPSKATFECNVCNKKMNSYEQLLLHNESDIHRKKAERIRSMLPDGDNTTWHTCQLCNKILNSIKSLRVHFVEAHKMTEVAITSYFDELQRTKMADKQHPSIDLRSNEAGDVCADVARNVIETVPKCPNEHLSKIATTAVELPKCSSSNPVATEDVSIHPHFGTLSRDSPSNVAPTFDGTVRNTPEIQLPFSTGAGISEACGKQSCMFHCETCSLCLNSVQQKTDHETGVQHLKKILHLNNSKSSPRNEKFYCALCDVYMNTQKNYDIHLNGQQHTLKAVKKVPAPERVLDPVIKSIDRGACLAVSDKLVVSIPRSYQVELYSKAMETDTVCFLPTGTGKTMVSIMVMSHMLRLNPRRPAVFLVDKILLVLQQSEEIRKEIGDQLFNRWNESTGKLEERKLRIAELCSGKQNLNESEVWQQDVVVITAAYYNNLLESGSLRWADNCLVIFDEVHHCVKQHPYRVILESARRSHPDPSQCPKVLGLTASPAGKSTIKGTMTMLQGLLSRLGDKVRLITVEEPEAQAELRRYQSNTELVVREVMHSAQEVIFRDTLRRFLLECWVRLKPSFQLPEGDELEANFGDLTKDSIEDHLDALTVDAASRLSDKLELVTAAERNVEFKVLRPHVQALCQALIALETLGTAMACEELSILLGDYFGGFSAVAQLGLPYEKLADLTKGFLKNQTEAKYLYDVGTVDEREDLVPVVRLLVKEIVERLECKAEETGDDKEKPLVLVLVRRRKDAQSLTRLLESSRLLKEHGMEVTYVVGHGAGKDGMPVGAQERVLNDVREHKYQVIVATSVAEEGLDFPLCELVVQLNPPDTVRALVQIRGRARKKGSRFLAFCQTTEQTKSFDDLREQEEHMIEAVRQLTTDPDTVVAD